MSSNIDELVDRINSIEQGSLTGDGDRRTQLISAAQALIIRLETPWDFIQRIVWQESILLMCLKIADDVKLFKHTGKHGSAPKSIEDLASATSVEPDLLRRITQHLAAQHLLITSTMAPDSYGATHITEALATDSGSSGIRHACNVSYPMSLEMPRFLKEIGYKTPVDSRNGVFQQMHGLRGLTKFECFQRPEFKHMNDDYNNLMNFTTEGRTSFLDVCDVAALLQQRPATLKISGHLLVDIGGGTGADTKAFRDRFADAPGIVELQDLAGAIESARADGLEDRGVSLRTHDFFTAQPVQGSRFYFMGSILHDWPEKDCLNILENVCVAMEPGYSTLLLSENTSLSNLHATAIDLTMLVIQGGEERREEKWGNLLRRAGLRIIKIYTISSCRKSVLECERVSSVADQVKTSAVGANE